MQLRSNQRYDSAPSGPRKRRRLSSLHDIEIANIAIQHNRQTTLFSFPQELRDIIYEHVWAQELDIAFQHYSIRLFACKEVYRSTDNTRNATIGLPAWLLASKDLLHEGLATFHRTRSFLLHTPNTPINPPFPKYNGSSPRIRNPLIFTTAMRSIVTSHPYLVGFEHHQGMMSLEWKPEKAHRALEKALWRLDMRDIDLRFHARIGMCVYAMPIIVWISYMEKKFEFLKGRCRSVEIDLIGLDSAREGDVRLLETAAERAARGIIAEEGSMGSMGSVERGRNGVVARFAKRKSRMEGM